jgi:hypothetical protein
MPIGKKKTALIDANWKKPTLRRLVSKNSTIKRFGVLMTILTVFKELEA